MGVHWGYIASRSPTSCFVPVLPPFEQVPFRPSRGTASRPHLPPAEAPEARPPGGVLMVAVLSAVSGAIMGCLFGGYCTIAAAIFITLPVGIAVGIWVRSLPE